METRIRPYSHPVSTSTLNVHACTKWSQSGRKKRNITAHVWSSSTSTVVYHTGPPGHAAQMTDSNPNVIRVLPFHPHPERDRLTPVHQVDGRQVPLQTNVDNLPKAFNWLQPTTTIAIENNSATQSVCLILYELWFFGNRSITCLSFLSTLVVTPHVVTTILEPFVTKPNLTMTTGLLLPRQSTPHLSVATPTHVEAEGHSGYPHPVNCPERPSEQKRARL